MKEYNTRMINSRRKGHQDLASRGVLMLYQLQLLPIAAIVLRECVTLPLLEALGVAFLKQRVTN